MSSSLTQVALMTRFWSGSGVILSENQQRSETFPEMMAISGALYYLIVHTPHTNNNYIMSRFKYIGRNILADLFHKGSIGWESTPAPFKLFRYRSCEEGGRHRPALSQGNVLQTQPIKHKPI